MATNQSTEHKGTALDTEIWIPLKEASAEAKSCDATIKRAIKGGKLVGRKVGTGHNASYEVAKTSFDGWLAAKVKPQREVLAPMTQPATDAAAEPALQPALQPATEPMTNLSKATVKPKLTKDERRKLKAARKKGIPESARRLRRWKNFMRHADQQQALAMIKWLSARLAPTKSLSKKILKEALKPEKTQAS